jgi:amino acid adenylation domain-containing protein
MSMNDLRNIAFSTNVFELDKRLIHAAFLRQALARPDNVAISFRGLVYSYGELDARSLGVANLLHGRGLGPGDRVAIIADRAPALVWSILAACRAGVAFMVIDSAYPKARIEDLIAVGAPTLLISVSDRTRKLAAELSAELGLATADALRAPRGGEALGGEIDPAGMAYMLFTSGSTGQPKGVACSHEPLTRFINWQSSAFHLGAEDRFSMLSGLSHDPLLRDVFAPLSLGAVLEIPEQAKVFAPGGVRTWLAETRCTVVHGTPAMGQLMTAGGGDGDLPDLRLVFWGGDLLSGKLVGDIARIAPSVENVNFYGATETPQAVSFFRIPPDQPRGLRAPIGAGVPGFQVLLLDEHGREVAAGETGEVAIVSRYLSLGYIERGQIAQTWPQTGAGDGTRLYRTGDIGRRESDDVVVLLGRRDDQVKIRGYRVDLSEIDAALRTIPGVTDAAVLPLREADDVKIAAFVAGPDAGTEALVSEALKAKLPAYMHPYALQILSEIPLLPNGKVDRKQLEIVAKKPARTARLAASATEAALMACWGPIFGREQLSSDDSFVSLGGDSLSYVQAYIGAQEAIGELPRDWTTFTIAELASLAPKKRRAGVFVEAPILIRALAILWVVAVHVGLVVENNAGTSALFLVSGYLFALLALTQAFTPGAKRPLSRYLLGLVAPIFVFGLAAVVLKFLRGGHPNLAPILMTEDLSVVSDGTDHVDYLWYLHAIVHVTALTCFAAGISRRFGARSAQNTLLALFAVGCITRFVAPALIYGAQLPAIATGWSSLSVLPSTHLATFCLGALFVICGERSRTPWLLGIPYAVLSAIIYGQLVGFGMAACMLAFAVGKIRIFKFAARPIYVIADASLFIYLLNAKAIFLMGRRPDPMMQFFVSVTIGVCVAFIWKSLRVSLQKIWGAVARQRGALAALVLSRSA